MQEIRNPFPLFLLPLFFISIMLTMQATTGQDVINSTCHSIAFNYDFCTTSLQAAPGSQCATPQGLGAIAIRLIQDNVTDTECYIKQLLKRGEWDDYAKACLKDCLELYSDAIDTAELAMEGYKDHRFDDVNQWISSIMTGSTTCEDQFQEGGAVSPLTKRNNDVYQLSAIVLRVMKMLGGIQAI